MADENLGALRISLGLDSAQFNNSIADLNRQLRAVRSEFAAASDGTREYENSIEGLSRRQDTLNREHRVHQQKVRELRRQYEESARTLGENAAETQNLAYRYNRARAEMTATENQIREVTDALEEARTGSRRTREALDDLGEAGMNAGKVLTPALAGIATGLGLIADNAGKTSSKIQATLGTTSEEAKKLTETAQNIWEKGFGEDMDIVSNGLLAVKRNMKGLNEGDLEQTAQDAIILGEVFEEDVNMVVRAGQNLITGFGTDSKEAFDLMAWGAQNGLNFSQEMFDNLSEYSPLFGKMGFSAQEYFQLLEKGSSAGVYNLDYINDIMKEFQIRTKDGSKATAEAMGQLSKGTQQVWKDFGEGKASVKEVHNAVIKDLKGMDDQVLANQIGVSLYGTKFEDLEADAVYALGGIDGELENVDGAMKRSGEAVDKTFSEKFQIAFRQAQRDLIPLGEKLLNVGETILPKVSSAIETAIDGWNSLSDPVQNSVLALGGIAMVAVPTIAAIGAIGSTFTTLSALIGASTAGTGLFAGLMAGLGAPVAIGLGAVAALGLGYIALDKDMDKPILKADIFSNKISESTKKAVNSYLDLESDAQSSLDRMVWGQETVTQTMADKLVGIYTKMGDQINGALDKSYQERKDKLTTYFATNEALSTQEEAKILAEMEKNNGKKKEEIDKYEQQIKQITQKSVDEKRAMTEQERQQIAEIQLKMRTTAVQTMSKSAEEQKIILGRLKSESSILTAEQSAKTVKDSKNARDGAVKEANKLYKEQKREFEYARDVTGDITKEQADKLIKDAKRQRDKSVGHAKTMHTDVLYEAQQQAGEHVDEVNWETGEVLSGWDRMYNGILKASNWIKGLFGIEKDKAKGTVKESGRNKQKRQNAEYRPYANGTPNGTHPGGLALVGEEGSELAHIPNFGTTLLGVGGQELINLPKGSSVLPHRHTQKVLSQYGIPMYASGIGDYFDIFTKGAGSIFDSAMEKFNIKNNFIPDWSQKMTGSPLKWAKNIGMDWIDGLKDKLFGSGGGGNQAPNFGGKFRFTSGYGQRWGKLHGGVDFAAPIGTPIPSQSGGVVSFASNGWNGGFGNLVRVRQGAYEHYYAHMSRILASVGQHVGKGSILGLVGSTGSSTGPHVHYELRKNGVRLNPGMPGFATGGQVDREQIVKVGEGNKKEMIIPLEQYTERAKQLWYIAGEQLGMFTPSYESVPSYVGNVSGVGTSAITNITNNYYTNESRTVAPIHVHMSIDGREFITQTGDYYIEYVENKENENNRRLGIRL